MSKNVAYCDDCYPSSWISGEWSTKILEALEMKGFDQKNAGELRSWLKDRLRTKDAHMSVTVFSQDIIPDTILGGLNSPNDLIRQYLDHGGRVVWFGDIPFWSKGHPKHTKDKDREEVWMYGTHYAMLGVEALIVESSSPSKWLGKWKGEMKSSWYSHRAANIEINAKKPRVSHLNLTIEPLAYVEATLLPCSQNASVIARWKKAGRKVGRFGLSAYGFGGNVTLTEEYPEELSLKPQKLACAWHVSFNERYLDQGFYRLWDCGVIGDEPPKNLIDDIYTMATIKGE